MIEEVKGCFRWRDVPSRGERQWATLRREIGCFKQQRSRLDEAILSDPCLFLEEGARTDELAELHETYISLTQRKARLEVDRDDLEAQAIQLMESYEVVSGVCSYRRRLQLDLNGESFRKAHRVEALESGTARDAYVHRKIFICRSY
jgi:hypothetical protein